MFVHDEILVCSSFILGYIWDIFAISQQSLVRHFVLSTLFLVAVAIFHFLVDKGIHHGAYAGKHARRGMIYSIVRMYIIV